MEKTTDFTFVDGDDTYQFSVTFTIPSARNVIEFERSRQQFEQDDPSDFGMTEYALSWLEGLVISVTGDANSIGELPAEWVGDVLGGIVNRGNGSADSATS